MEESVEYQRQILRTLEAIQALLERQETTLKNIHETDEKILAQLLAENTDNDITSLGGSISTPTKINP
jgi:hypothetical protein